jgi:histidinol-phosphate aminotransferase
MTALTDLDGIEPYPSDANFILVRTVKRQAGAIFEGLEHRGVLIKRLDGTHPLLADCLRITVGTAEENRALLAALRETLAALPTD